MRLDRWDVGDVGGKEGRGGRKEGDFCFLATWFLASFWFSRLVLSSPAGFVRFAFFEFLDP